MINYFGVNIREHLDRKINLSQSLLIDHIIKKTSKLP